MSLFAFLISFPGASHTKAIKQKLFKQQQLLNLTCLGAHARRLPKFLCISK